MRSTLCRSRKSFRSLSILGIILVIMGVASLRLGHFSYHNWVPAVNAGPIHLDAHMEHRVSAPTVAGVFVLLAGFGFIVMRWQKA
jgi:hypothetical protein